MIEREEKCHVLTSRRELVTAKVALYSHGDVIASTPG